jgi:hypothetical protein
MKVRIGEGNRFVETLYTVTKDNKKIFLGVRNYPELLILKGPTGKYGDYDIASLSIFRAWLRPKYLFASSWSIDHFMEFLKEREESP